MNKRLFYTTAFYSAVFFYCNIVLSQSGRIEYKNKATIGSYFNEIKEKSELEFKRYEALAIYERDIKRKIRYELKFNQNSSLFQPIVNEDANTEVKTGMKAEGIYYKDSISNICFINRRFENFEIQLFSVEWTISNEEKNILGYKCFKAIGYKKTKKSDKETKKKIEAWYTKDIKLEYGPMGFGDLPGIILQLDYGSYHLLATSIEIDQDIEIKKPDIKSKKITEFEFSKMMKTRNK